MTAPFQSSTSRWLWSGIVLLVAGIAWASNEWWLPPLRETLTGTEQTSAAAPTSDGHSDHEHDHGHAHDDEHGSNGTDMLELSRQARNNIGLKLATVARRDYQRSIAVPAMVVEKPGRTRIDIVAPMTGIVTSVAVLEGQAVESGTILFRLRVTHEDLVATQTEFVQTLGQLEVERREIDRLERVTSSGAVAGKALLERKYEAGKLEATASAQREALLLHGLSEAQVQQIADTRKLIREITVTAPLMHDDSSLHHEAENPERHEVTGVSHPSDSSDTHSPHSRRFVVDRLNARRGQSVNSGEALCTLADFSELYLEGMAFEQDADEVIRTANSGRPVSALLHGGSAESETISDLEVSHVANDVDLDSRTLHFYVRLPNEIVRDAVRSDGRHFLTWRFKPGQRMQLRLPVERWERVLVLPVEAIAQDGLETYVFVEHEDHLVRRPVHVRYRDQTHAVLADGSLFPGETVAVNSAHQLQMALKNQAGGGVDPHAGHSH